MKHLIFYSPGEGNSNSDASTTDNTKLVTTDTVYVSPDGGTTNEPFPAQGVEYDFCVDVLNGGNQSSGPFYVRFTLSGDQDPPFQEDFQQEAGLDAGSSVKAVVHFGTFPNEFKSYFLEACIYSPSAPDKPINCAGTFDFAVNTESTDSGEGSSPGSSDNTDNSSSSDSTENSNDSSNDSSTDSSDDSSNDSSDTNNA